MTRLRLHIALRGEQLAISVIAFSHTSECQRVLSVATRRAAQLRWKRALKVDLCQKVELFRSYLVQSNQKLMFYYFFELNRDKKVVRVENPQYKLSTTDDSEQITLGVGPTVRAVILHLFVFKHLIWSYFVENACKSNVCIR